MLIARQVPPDEQGMFLDSFNEKTFPDLIIKGNNDYMAYYPDERIESFLDMCEDYNMSVDININDLIDDISKYTYDEDSINNIIQIIKNADWGFDNEETCQLLTYMSGDTWDYEIKRGLNQGEWQYFFYNTKVYTHDEDLEIPEREYFNNGSEWELMEENGEEIGYIYCHDDYYDWIIKKEIAETYGYNIEDIKLLWFNTYEKNPTWIEKNT